MQLSYLEDFDSKIPAIQVLCALGWKYLSRDEAMELRDNRPNQVILTGVLKPWLAANARFEVRGKEHEFSEVNLNEAIASKSEVGLDTPSIPIRFGLFSARNDSWSWPTAILFSTQASGRFAVISSFSRSRRLLSA